MTIKPAVTEPIEGLKPCPFCGGPAELEEVDGGGWSVGCEEKAASVHYCMGYQSLTSFATKREAIAAWNTRRPPYNGPPCPSCSAAHPFDNVFCSNGFHAPPETRASPKAVPVEELRKYDLEWLKLVATGSHGDVTLHSGMAIIRLERIANRLEAMTVDRGGG